MADVTEAHAGRAEAAKLTSQLIAFAKSDDRQHHIDLGHLFSSQWFHSQTEAENITLRPLPAGLELQDKESATPVPPQWEDFEAFQAAMDRFNAVVNPYLPSWLPSVVLGDGQVLNHDIACPVQYLDGGAWVGLDSDCSQARFLRQCADIAYSVLESKRGREILQKVLRDIITRWDAEGESHAFQYGRRNNRRFREASRTVDYFLDVLRLMPPTIKLVKTGNVEATWIHGNILLDENRTEPIALDDFVPRSELEIRICPVVLHEIIGIAACMVQPNMASYEREKLIESWIHHLMRTSLSFANHFAFLFERMLAGGARRGCPRFGRQWPTDAAGNFHPGNGFTAEDIEWLKDPRRAPMPAGMKDKLYDYIGGAWQTEMFGGVIVFAEHGQLAGPWKQIREEWAMAFLSGEFVTDWEKSTMKSLFPELRRAGRQLKLVPITERHLK
ncbi:hypothetical protein VUR80DRAFT_5158 [Thermomyces stellatus]